jgi:hypothetical protein
MELVTIQPMDGKGPLQVCCKDLIAATRLTDFLRDAKKAFAGSEIAYEEGYEDGRKSLKKEQ